MDQGLERLKARVLNKGSSQGSSPDPFIDFFHWAELFMFEYKMSLEDFKGLNIQAFLYLRRSMAKRYEPQKKEMEKAEMRKMVGRGRGR